MVNQNKILGDCIEEMQKLIDDGVQIDSIVTDPPYHLTSIVKRFGKEGSAPVKVNEFFNKKNGESKGSSPYKRTSTGFMGKEWDGGDVAFRSDTWKLAYNLLKPGGHLLAFSASRNYHRMAVAIEDAGFEIRDQIMWIYGSGFPKSLNIGKGVDKKLGNEREVIGKGKPMSSLGVMHDDNWQSDSEYNQTKGNSEWEGWGTALKPAHEPIVMARKPLEGTNIDNVLKYGTGGINIDGCRIQGDDTGSERKITNRKSRNENGVWTDENSGMKADGAKFADADPKGRYPANVMHDGLQEEWARYFYCPKVSKSERNNSTIKNTHPTVKPIKLMRYLCRLVTPKGGVVLDPFMGSGSTGIATKQENFQFIGIEKEKEYYDIACKRIEAAIEQNDLFNF
tara:strand:- start:1513 stop:2697 length:1185 start_codon:yes stop_codon:yes gene_type:complete